MLDILEMVFFEIKENKLRFVLSVFTFVVSTCFVMIILLLGDGFKDGLQAYIENEFSSLSNVITCRINSEENTSANPYKLKKNELEYLLDNAPSEYIVDILRESNEVINGNVIGESNCQIKMKGVSKGYLEFNKSTLQDGRFITEKDCIKRRNIIVIPEFLKEKLGIKNICGKKIQIYDDEKNKIYLFYIVGVYKSNDNQDEMIYFPYNLFEDDEELAGFRVLITERKYVDETKNYLQNFMSKRYISDDDYKFQIFYSNIMRSLNSVLQIIIIFLVLIAFLTMIISGVGIRNIMAEAVLDRVQEIGIKKALGCDGRRIKLEILLETILICVMGNVISLFLIYILLTVINANIDSIFYYVGISDWCHIQLHISNKNMLLVTFMSMIIGFFASYVPAIHAEKMNIILALKRE